MHDGLILFTMAEIIIFSGLGFTLLTAVSCALIKTWIENWGKRNKLKVEGLTNILIGCTMINFFCIECIIVYVTVTEIPRAMGGWS